jgi:hypothetical protein
MKPPIQTVLTPMPLAIMPPLESSGTNPPLMETRFEEFLSKLKEINEGFKGEIMKALQAMSEQMSCLVKNQDPNLRPPPHESGMHPSGMWCTTCKQVGHAAQFCTMIVQPQVPPYRPTHHVNQPMNPPQGNSQDRQKFPVCRTCGGRHVLGTCWVELGIKCFNCGGTHRTDRVVTQTRSYH